MLTINPSELIWAVISFFVLLFLLKRFLYTPLTRFMDERSARVQAGLDERRHMDETLEENARRLEELEQRQRQEAHGLLDEQRQSDDRRRAESVSRARQQAADTEAEARREADELRRSTERELSRRREALGLDLAERLLDADAPLSGKESR